MRDKVRDSINSRAWRDRNKAQGLCPCGRERNNPNKVKCQFCVDRRLDWYKANQDLIMERGKQAWLALKDEVINHYGGKCVCCGEDWHGFLVLDHIDGGGTKERQRIFEETGSRNMYSYIKRFGYPEGLRVLCANCNMAKGKDNRPCIHELERAA